MTWAAAYDVHGVTVAVRSASRPVLDAVDRRLRSFRSGPPDPAAADMPEDVIVDLVVGQAGDARPPAAGHGRPVYDAPGGQVFYDDADDLLWLDHPGSAWLRVEPSVGTARLWAAGDGEDDVWLVSHPLLTIALLELLKRRGRYSLHAAAMASTDGTVTLLAGGSGAGKTTLALALLRHGWAFLADDTVFLGAGEPGPTVLGFADEVDVGGGTADLLPGLDDLLAGHTVPGRDKRQLRVEEAFGATPVPEARPTALVFPAVGGDDRSRLEPLAPDEALVELAPNVLLTEPASSQAHLDALAALVRTTPCWRLETGRDFGRLAGMLRGLSPTLPAPPDAVRLVPG